MDKLPIELYTSISRFLRPVDMIRMSHLDSTHKVIYNNEITKRFQKWERLSAYFKHPDEFLKLFNKKCLLSGSIVLQFLLNESYDSDIDIFLTLDNLYPVTNFLMKEKFKMKKQSNAYYSEDESDNSSVPTESDNEDVSDVLSEDVAVDSGIARILTFERDCFKNKYNYKNCKVQLIVTKDPIESIKNFDFNFVKNYYNGKQIYFRKEVLNKTEYMSLSDFTRNMYNSRWSMRINKYISRGFKIVIDKV